MLPIPPYMFLPTPSDPVTENRRSCPTKPISHPMRTSKPDVVSRMVSLSTSGVSLVSAQSEIYNGIITPLPPPVMAAASCAAVDTHSPELIGRIGRFVCDDASRCTVERASSLAAAFLMFRDTHTHTHRMKSRWSHTCVYGQHTHTHTHT